MFKKHRVAVFLFVLLFASCSKEEILQPSSVTEMEKENQEAVNNITLAVELDCEENTYFVRKRGQGAIKYKFVVDNDSCYFSHLLLIVEKSDDAIMIDNSKVYIDNKAIPVTVSSFNDSLMIVARNPAKTKVTAGEHTFEVRYKNFGSSGENYRLNLLDNNLRFVDRNRFYVNVVNTPLYGPEMIFR